MKGGGQEGEEEGGEEEERRVRVRVRVRRMREMDVLPLELHLRRRESLRHVVVTVAEASPRLDGPPKRLGECDHGDDERDDGGAEGMDLDETNAHFHDGGDAEGELHALRNRLHVRGDRGAHGAHDPSDECIFDSVDHPPHRVNAC